MTAMVSVMPQAQVDPLTSFAGIFGSLAEADDACAAASAWKAWLRA
jgi:hypothetical protein